jgi:hypothetical protein
MWLAIAGGVVVVCVGLAAVYDKVSQRRGRNAAVGSAPGNASFSSQSDHTGFGL